MSDVLLIKFFRFPTIHIYSIIYKFLKKRRNGFHDFSQNTQSNDNICALHVFNKGQVRKDTSVYCNRVILCKQSIGLNNR